MRRREQQRSMARETADLLDREAQRLLEQVETLERQRRWLLVESAELENQGLEGVARFELEREAVLQAQIRLHAAELVPARSASVPRLRERFEAAQGRKEDVWERVEMLWTRSRVRLEQAARLAAKMHAMRREAAQLREQAALVALPFEEQAA